MTLYVGPMVPHVITDPRPPGITGGSWCHLVSTVDQPDLEAFLTDNLATVQCPVENVRTPALGSTVTYVALSSDQRDAVIALGVGHTPSDGKCYAQCFDKVPGATWEPV